MKTQRVRIAVGVYEGGHVVAQAVGGFFTDEKAAEIAACFIGHSRVTFIEADLPTPDAETVEARVVPQGGGNER